MMKTTHPLDNNEKYLLMHGFICIASVGKSWTWVDLFEGGGDITYFKSRGNKRCFLVKGNAGAKVHSVEAAVTISRHLFCTD